MAVILVTSRSFSDGDLDLVTRANDAGHRIMRGPAHHDLAELRPLLHGADAWIAGTGAVTAEHLDVAPKLKIIARYGVGVEAVDLDAAADRGILVTNTPGANAAAVADHAVGLMLAALRTIPDGDRRVRDGDWSVRRGRELGAATVGIVGFGRIGQGVAARLGGFGPRIVASDPFLPDERVRAAGAEPLELDDLFRTADVITLHAPGGQQLVDAARLAEMRLGTILVNTARPDLIDEDAVAAALADGSLAGYAADTLDGDTAASNSPLLDDELADRVIVTPHLGAQTTQAVDNMGRMSLDDVIAVLRGDDPRYPVRRTA
ncbi:D-3-phosphoglycerate dehydrogenase [Microbacterium esteraromaticum]|uniref:D-3-phosphoglycerate dehydrogenase n=1 Tax=Microbacterium esteraromaticum TaxID=57043 RepID=A0A1R4K7J9_9MICO|nr:NAD(P)-dependent oxidoreductase [Microbacterium esteraromaticum]SJN40164.1 D-3-phosphoglycerate dehydrogenase [Microbacterium esteraromaticum]